MKTLLLTTALLAPAACATSRGPVEDPTDPREMVRLIVPDGYEGPVFIILDPLLGVDPPFMPDGFHYRFDDQGVFRVITRAQWGLSRIWVKAFQRNGEPIFFRRSRWSGGTETILPSAQWWISLDKEGLYSRWQDLVNIDELRKRGVPDLEWTPERRALHAAFNAESADTPPAAFPREPGPGRPQPVFLVPAGFAGPVFLITDPFLGAPPSREGDRLVFRFPESGVLRVRLTEAESGSRSWPLVYDAAGAQLWLRPLAKSTGFDTLPIVSYLVCPNATELPGYPENARASLQSQLRARGVTDLAWPKPAGAER